MSNRWKLGNYTFLNNPSDSSQTYEIVGDTVTTLNGNVISQPSGYNQKYSIQALFFQHRPRLLSTVGMSNAIGIEFFNGDFYALNKVSNTIDVYSSNLSTLNKSITLPAMKCTQYVSFDLDYQGNFYILSYDGAYSYITCLSSGGNLSYDLQWKNAQGTSIEYVNSYLYIVTTDNEVRKVNPSSSLVELEYAVLPSTSGGYRGSTSTGQFLIVSYCNNGNLGTYHIDTNTGSIVNNFEVSLNLTSSSQINLYSNQQWDLAFDGINYVFLYPFNSTLFYSSGNTVMLDLYNLEQEILNNGYIKMIDDMGNIIYVAITDYSIDRKDNALQKYQVTMNIQVVDRGVNQ